MPDSPSDIINRVCDEFDQAWSNGKHPELGQCLSGIPNSDQEKLLDQLLQIELEYRRKSGESISGSDYSHIGREAAERAQAIIDSWRDKETIVGASSSISVKPSESRRIGRYKLLQLIDEGGMGSVWMAEQDDELYRRVALKLIRADRGSKETIARFEAERQALAMMDHENIAKVLDAGTTDEGNPFFVMELVKGVPITRYCDENKLSIEARLALMTDVCRAIQHAHQKGIIHRDLKPSNVLVALYDGKPVPKVIDFGLAKALEHTTKLTDKTMFTEFGKVVGTLQYMSPEQAEMNALDVDTRTDIYSLGVMLYELLTGSTPIEKETLGRNALLQVLEIIRDKEPPLPSSRLSSSGDASTGISNQRKITFVKLQQILKGELDWVIMKALEKNRTRRYDSSTSLAADIQRFLDGDPVLARPPSKSYLLRKFVSKNRRFVTVAAIMVALAALAAFGTVNGLVRATASAANEKAAKEDAQEKQSLADQRAREAHLAKNEAETTANRTRNVLQIVTGAFESVDPRTKDSKGEMSAKDVLLNAKKNMELSNLDAIGKAELLKTLTSSFQGLGEYSLALETGEWSLDLQKRIHGESHRETLRTKGQIATALGSIGKLEKAIELHQSLYEEMKVDLGEYDEDTILRLHNLANAYSSAGRFKRAIECFENALELRKKHCQDKWSIVATMLGLSSAYINLDRFDDAAKLLVEAEDLASLQDDKEHYLLIEIKESLASLYLGINPLPSAEKGNRLEKATNLLEECLEANQKKFGEQHPSTISNMSALASAYWFAKRFDDSIELHEKAYAANVGYFGEEHSKTIYNVAGLANAYEYTNRLPEAIEFHEKAVSLVKKALGEDHINAIITRHNLALAYSKVDRYEDAIRILKNTFEKSKELLGPNHSTTFENHNSLARMYRESERWELAAELYYSFIAAAEKVKGTRNHRDIQITLTNLGICLNRLSKFEEAVEGLEEAISINKAAPHYSTLARVELTNAYLSLENFEAAEKLIQEDANRARNTLEPKTREYGLTMLVFGSKMIDAKNYSAAEQLLKDGFETRKAIEPDSWGVFNAESLLGYSLLKQERYNESKTHLIKGLDGLKKHASEIPESVRLERLEGAVNRLIELAKETEAEKDLQKWKAELQSLQTEHKKSTELVR